MMALKECSVLSSLTMLVVYFLLVFPCLITIHEDALPTSKLTVESSIEVCSQDPKLKEAWCDNRRLTSIPQDLAEDIELLSTQYNNVKALLNSSFVRYPLITTLDLRSNDIRTLDHTAFYPLRDLMNLFMSFNPHLVLPDTGLFRWASKLSILDLSNSNMISLPNDTLKWSKKLERLQLSRNQFAFINISSCGMVKNVHLEGNQLAHLSTEFFNLVCDIDFLVLVENPIKSIDPNVIASLNVRELLIGNSPLTMKVFRNLFMGISCSEIEFVTIIGSNLTAFPVDFFDSFCNCPLSFLSFYTVGLKALSPYLFSNLTQLDKLSLSSNSIVTIEPDFFEGMQDLRILKLQSNNIQQINPYNQTWNIKVQELQLYNNLLIEISQSSFLGLKYLTLLDLSRNKGLTFLEFTAFTGLESIQKIVLSECNIHHLLLETPSLTSLVLNNIIERDYGWDPRESVKHLRSLIYLNLGAMDLGVYDLWFMNVSLFDGMDNLTTLYLSKNTDLGSYSWGMLPGSFQKLTTLQNLNLDDCNILSLHSHLFHDLVSLRMLSLTGNRIQQLRYDMLTELRQLTRIYLDRNLLSYLDETIFSNNLRLEYLSLADNKLTRLNQSTFRPIKNSLSSLDISENPLLCNCDLKWLLDWQKRSPNLTMQHTTITICSSASLAPLREKPLRDFDPSNLCRLSSTIPCFISLAVICMVVIAVLVHHHRWHLRYKLFLLKLALVGYKEVRDARNHNDYEFDVNVICYDDDEEWIRDHLRPALEEKLPQFQRNVFGDEDVVPGMHYLDAVYHAVTRSYKTLIVLSRAAVRDRWFMLKLRIAMDHVSDTRTEFVVVVFLEDIPDDEIPFMARLYLNDGRPYLYWTDDVRGQEYFWNKLAKNLTINLKTDDLIPNE
eukprot:XP_011684029.1 PREDICTED: toll-like receptor 3 [Strongylocentrotus purpuratus]